MVSVPRRGGHVFGRFVVIVVSQDGHLDRIGKVGAIALLGLLVFKHPEGRVGAEEEFVLALDLRLVHEVHVHALQAGVDLDYPKNLRLLVGLEPHEIVRLVLYERRGERVGNAVPLVFALKVAEEALVRLRQSAAAKTVQASSLFLPSGHSIWRS